MFSAVLGESIGDLYGREDWPAGGDLIYTEKRILDIAIDYRFEDQESFSRAFKKVYRFLPAYTGETGLTRLSAAEGN